jgi:glutaredoxin
MRTTTIYTTPTCGYWKMAKEFFKEHTVVYTEKDVAVDQAAAEEMIEKSGQMGVPVTIVSEDGKEEFIVGFDKSRLSSALGVSA